jgi:very-short-patch-repair endonuclease
LTVTEHCFLQRLRDREILQPDREYKAIADRRFRIDWAWPEQKLALEVEGGVWTGGRHTRGGGFLADMEKYNLLAVAGWRLLRCQPKELANYATIDLIARALAWVPGT